MIGAIAVRPGCRLRRMLIHLRIQHAHRLSTKSSQINIACSCVTPGLLSAENVKSGRNRATGTRQFVLIYHPAWTKLSNTILRPALSKSTVSLLPSTVATVPVPNFA